MILVDKQIRQLSLWGTDVKGLPGVEIPWWVRPMDNRPMIEPFSEMVSGGGVIGYGLTSAGYDLRLAGEWLIFKNTRGRIVDPKMFGDPDYRSAMFDEGRGEPGDPVLIPPNGYVLGRSLEYLRIPRQVKGHCLGKSTLARSGILINTTPLEPEWEGHLTIEISNVTPSVATVFVGEGIAQLEFHLLSDQPEVSYRDRGGKYQGQVGVTPAVVR